MGGNESSVRKMSFGLDENEKVTVLEGVKLSEDVLRWMLESDKPPPPSAEPQKPPSGLAPTGIYPTEMQEEIRKNLECQQAMVQDELTRLAQREKEAADATGLAEMTPDLIIERGKVHEEREKAKIIAKQLERKEKELGNISKFYKEQLEVLEKRNLDNYHEVTEQYKQAATKAEARIRSRTTAPLCTDLQAKVLQCYRENPQQSLHCSSLAKQYIACVQQAKSSLSNQG
ncbi:coiled-coil-helix-coiled-coil-helix domain containing 6b [Antennarius striatus]|uniref:coiled-coil-helix-coiled-coil-helix domain containing 6b n=1 Tax=Antennarius striatus TaxID=241820 RepID=UPI0035AFEB72